MNSETRSGKNTAARALASLCMAALAASCSGPSSYNSSANPPHAIAHAVGAEPTSAAGADPVTITVRAQSQVTLTGNASDGGAAAIATFAWAQADAAPAPQVELLYLDADTVTFTAPAVGADTTLHFTLTVKTAGNAAASAHAVVLVKAVNDVNQFLALLPTTASPTATVQHHFKVSVNTVEGLGPLASPKATLAADVPVCVTVKRTINYVNRNGTQSSVPLSDLQADSSWAANIGGAPNDFTSYSNPKVAFEIPALNQDDIAVLYNNPVPDGSNAAATRTTNLGLQLVGADVDKAQLSLMASAAPGPCSSTATKTTELAGKTLQVAVQDEYGNAVGAAGASATFTPDKLVSQQANTSYETAETAKAYYAAIDPNGAKTTLDAWLTANCFDPTKSDFGADAHGVYTNNYDLGFGRDMYFTTCKSGSTPAGARAGDMASVVINYASLEGAASKLNPVIAVAMEYSAAVGSAVGSRRFPKFYIFAPDDRDGKFHRISSANFDHRGEKFLPGACIMCHGGHIPQPTTANFVHSTATDYPTLPDPTVNAAGRLGLGDVDATFLPWDLDSLLYSSAPSQANTDSSFVGLSVDASQFTRSAQEPNLKKLNQLAYCTYQPEMEKVGTATVDRFNAVRSLVGRWYGGAPGSDKVTYPVDASCAQGGAPTDILLPNSTYDDADSTPAGWTAKAAAQQQPGVTPTLSSDMLYHQVFARNCRACHTSNAAITDQFTDYPTFIQQFASPQQKVSPPAAPGLGIQYAFTQGRMPLARLTMDRFWVDFVGGDSAAKLLATHVAQVNGETDLTSPAACDLSGGACDPVPPGTPVPNLSVTIAVAAPIALPPQGPIALTPYGAGTAAINRFGGVAGDASPSFFVGSYHWTLCLTPPTGGTCAPQEVAGTQSALPSFDNSAPGEYDLTLAADNGFGGTQSKKYKFTVTQKNPSLSACPSTQSFAIGPTNPPIDFSGCITGGDEPAANLPNAFEIQDPSTGTWATSVAATDWTASTSTSATLVGQQYAFTYALSFAFNSSATGDVPNLAYRVRDVDGIASATGCPAAGAACGGIDLKLTDTLSAGGNNFVFTPPAVFSAPVSYTIPGSSLGNTIVPPGASGVTMVVPSTLGGVPSTVTVLPAPGTPQFPLGGSLASSSVSAQSFFTFTPAQSAAYVFLNCDVNGHALGNTNASCTSADSFWYYLLAADLTTTSPNVGEITVQIKATTSFSRSGASSVYTQLGTQCASCHGVSGSAAALEWFYDATANGIDNTYSNIALQISKGNGTASALYSIPCTQPYFDGANMAFAGTAVCTTILNWINEGAYND